MPARKSRKPGSPPRDSSENKSEQLSVRVSGSLRDELEREAKRNGRTLSREIQHRLAQSLTEKKRLHLETDQTFWLGFLVRQVANRLDLHTGKSWRRDRYTFNALDTGLKIVLSEFTPDGDVAIPDRIAADMKRLEKALPDLPTEHRQFEKPEGLAWAIALGLIDQVKDTPAPPVMTAPNQHYAYEFYWCPRARKALGLEGD